jgi:hypothetical protein
VTVKRGSTSPEQTPALTDYPADGIASSQIKKSKALGFPWVWRALGPGLK